MDFPHRAGTAQFPTDRFSNVPCRMRGCTHQVWRMQQQGERFFAPTCVPCCSGGYSNEELWRDQFGQSLTSPAIAGRGTPYRVSTNTPVWVSPPANLAPPCDPSPPHPAFLAGHPTLGTILHSLPPRFQVV